VYGCCPPLASTAADPFDALQLAGELVDEVAKPVTVMQ
jgi:hypothetical protein